MVPLDKQAWLHSFKCYLAAMLALYIALVAELPRPFWAMTTAYIVMQPVMGGTNSRGIYRVLGTMIAGVAVVVMVPNLLHEPLLLTFAMCLWLSGCLFISMLKRGPSAYIFLLAGYTASFVGFPAVTSPDTIFDVAIARVQEIILGSLCAVVVGAVVFPRSIKPQVRQRVGALMGDSLAWCCQVLERQSTSQAQARRLAGELTQLDLIIPFASRDDPRHGDLGEWLEELRACLLGILPVVASIEDRLTSLEQAGALDEGLAQLLGDLALWLKDPQLPDVHSLESMRRRAFALRTGVTGDPVDMQRESLLLRLKELADIWYDCRQLQSSIEGGEEPPPPAFGLGLRGLVRLENRHVDWGMNLFRALAPGATLFVYCVLWIRIGWPGGDFGAMMAAVAAAFFAAQDDPAPSIMEFLRAAIYSIVLGIIYVFGILPALHDFLPLALVLAPLLLACGLMLSSPKWFGTGLPILANFCTLIAIQNHARPNFEQFTNNGTSITLGLMFAVIMTRLFRSMGAEVMARRLLRQAWRLLADAAGGRGSEDRDRFMVHMLDLLGLMAPRLAALPEGSDIAAVNVMGDVRIGLNILNLRRARNGLPALSRGHINRTLALIGEHFGEQSRRLRQQPPSDELRDRLDRSLRRLRTLPASSARDEALLGLVGLRQGLFREESPTPLAGGLG